MSMPERSLAMAVAAIAGCAVLAAGSLADEGPGLGTPATEEQVAGWAISVLPDGDGLPPGSGTARDGAALYEQQCLACHGAEGQGGPNDRLAGGHDTIDTDNPVRTVGSYWPYATTVFDYVRRAMPLDAPLSLSDDETYALTAYLLHINGLIDEDEVIDADTLPEVDMPNRDNFVWAIDDPADD